MPNNRTPSAGTFQSRSGEDFVQYIDSTGAVMSRLDCYGVHYCQDIQTASGISLSNLQTQVTNLAIGASPAPPINNQDYIDGGTF
jgi:hypothetical protein